MLVLLLVPLAPACASHSEEDAIEAPEEVDDEPAPREHAAQEDPRCDAPPASPCTKGDVRCIKFANKQAIKCEYEMLDARKQGDQRAFECWRKCLTDFLDEICSAGEASGCQQLEALGERLPS